MEIVRNTQRFARKFAGGASFIAAGALVFALMGSQTAKADSIHLACLDGAACGNAGHPSTQTDSTNPPTFGFTYSGTGTSPISGSLVVDFLVPVADGSATISVTGSATDTGAILVSSTPWTTGDLADYLGDVPGASPTNPIGAYTTGNPSGGGYDVYEMDLGTQTLCQTATPCFTLTANGVPVDTYILGFFGVTTEHGSHPATTNWNATANSEAILETAPPVPEPSSLMLLGSGVLGLAGVVRRKFRG